MRAFELHVAGAHSLKDKRSVIKSLRDRLSAVDRFIEGNPLCRIVDSATSFL